MTRGSARKLSRQLGKVTDEVVATHFPHPTVSSQLCVRGGSAMLPVEERPVPVGCEDERIVRAIDVLRSARNGSLQVVVGMGLSALPIALADVLDFADGVAAVENSLFVISRRCKGEKKSSLQLYAGDYLAACLSAVIPPFMRALNPDQRHRLGDGRRAASAVVDSIADVLDALK